MTGAPQRIELGEGCWLEWWPDFLGARADDRLQDWVDELPLRADRFSIFGRSVAVPRLVAWVGDPGCRYRYSGQTYEPAAWTPRLTRLRRLLSKRVGLAWNGVLANYYRDGRDSVGWHADDERELGPAPDDVAIASLSLGAVRRFRMRPKCGEGGRELRLPHGSLLVMRGLTQRHWQHCLPKTRAGVGPRLNLSFRVVSPREAPASRRPQPR